MEKLQQLLEAEERKFVTTTRDLLHAQGADRIKIAKLYVAYVRLQGRLNTLVEEHKYIPEHLR